MTVLIELPTRDIAEWDAVWSSEDTGTPQHEWEGPIVQPGEDLCAWLCWLMARDLNRWNDSRRVRLSREEAMSLLLYMSDHLTAERRAEIITKGARAIRSR